MNHADAISVTIQDTMDECVFEIMEVNDEIRDLISENGSTEELERAARNSGMRTLRENGIRYVLDGTTSVEEMLKASYE